MIIYTMRGPLTPQAVRCARYVAPLLEQVGHCARIMGTWDDMFPVYEVVRVSPQVLQVQEVA